MKYSDKELRIISSREFQNVLSELCEQNAQDFVLQPPKDFQFPVRMMAEQLKCQAKVKKKCPDLSMKSLVFLSESLEQSSSQYTARFKASFMQGKRLVDLSCGLGIDAVFLAEKFSQVDLCEHNSDLLRLTRHNLKQLGMDWVGCHAIDGVEFIKTLPNHAADWIYVDPSRRPATKRAISLEQSEPDVTKLEDLLLKKAPNVCIKASPLLDLTECKRSFKKLGKLMVVSLNGECKEVLLILSAHSDTRNCITKAIGLSTKKQEPVFCVQQSTGTSEPGFECADLKDYIYDPDAAILKTGLWKKLTMEMDLEIFNSVVPLLTSAEKIESFPGRAFRVLDVLTFQKKNLQKLFRKEGIGAASIMRRHFPATPEHLRAEFKLKESQTTFLIFTTLHNRRKVCIIAEKITPESRPSK
jgi:hypothetical protein